MSGPSQSAPQGGGELHSLRWLPPKDVKPAPQVNDYAPSSSKLSLPTGKLTIVVFLRHCGCPFAEKTFKALTALSDAHKDIQCIAVSHSSEEATERWVPQVGGTWNVEVVVDEDRDLYAQWGLGPSSAWATMGPSVLWSVYKLGTGEGIWNRPTESGSRWQTGGAFAINRFGKVVYAHVDKSADDMPNLDEVLEALTKN
ncbi:uncharacterized protein F5Z01DRAFT_38201 [Emericellopsis atlantica]|uniref:Thioredoxin domain-containing protein n=1 Tax=Emericellopsis atlantica TaxID=2614577 RepID=A0A9P7ZP93_9HYPO|nr:uncharacterized protein F5Z01DRAFT_38201 [Emericellopsis atlantica]KAG9255215.1 hypothetical protein F5Z01DRAFT_38201 [Emericellopsis atlantica]